MSEATPAFAEWIEDEAERVDQALQRLASRIKPTGVVASAVQYAIAGGGKRLRPALCIAAHNAVGGNCDPDQLADLACCVELIHTYSLVHDDLPCMDNDDMRRGRPTTHRAYGTTAAMAAGAALIPLAFRVLRTAAQKLGLEIEWTQAISLELARASGGGGMVGGQVLDLGAEGRAIALDDLEQLYRLKTGALIGAAARIGALAGRANHDQRRALRTYTRCLGLAFQITDDVLDETTSSVRLGKTAGKDRAVAKATFPAMIGLDGARERAASEAEEALTALSAAGIRTPELEGIARFAIARDR